MNDTLKVLNDFAQLNVQTSPLDTVIEGGAQKQQIFNVECVSDFSEPPLLVIQFQ